MKLAIEIFEITSKDDGKLKVDFDPKLQPDSKDGEYVHDKTSQIENISRLIELAEVLKKTAYGFYEKYSTEASIEERNTSGEPSTK